MKTKYATLCSGIEAVSVALAGLDAEPVFFSDIEPFPKAVLAHHYPGVPDLGDMTQWMDWDEDLLAEVDLLVAGTPCQAFSVAGSRKSLSDDRGNLTLIFVEIINAIDRIRRHRGSPPVTIVWENVPGVLSTRDNAFGCFLAALVGGDAALPAARGKTKWTGAGVVSGPQRTAAWRVLDAQYFGVAQRRRRVFVVASAGNGPHPAEVLFEREGLRRDSAPSREAGPGFTHDTAPSLTASGRGVERTGESRGQDPVVAVGGDVSHTLRGEGFDGSEDGTGRGTPVVAIASGQANAEIAVDVAPCLNLNRDGAPIAFQSNASADQAAAAGTGLSPSLVCHDPMAVAFQPRYARNGRGAPDTVVPALTQRHQILDMAVRRLTPVECERLQGFPDNYTQIPYRGKGAEDCPAGPRYKALGNSMAVPVMRWILKRVMA